MILNEAVALASQVGLEGLSIGSLASRLGLSKSGLFAHFGSKEDLQVLTLKQAQSLFQERVFLPALKEARGLPRLRALFSNWLAWLERKDPPGGCVMLAASVEYDDRPGAVRDVLVAGQRELRGAIAKAIRLAIDAGHLKPQTDPWQLGFELLGIVLAAHHDRRLLDDTRSLARAQAAFERLIETHRPVAAS
ncbi:MAG TPA: helix-turn-helix domain-containing protein [Burkholderiales bacterium]|nr:helix-turn-helix domain-containing protein [Burkholderiales bacterium]